MAADLMDQTNRLFLVGINQRSAAADLRARLFVEEPDVAALLNELRVLGFRESMAIATCERLELLAVREDGKALAEPLFQMMAARSGLTPAEVASAGYCHEGLAVLRHVFAVTASLDSQMVGESRVLGQMRALHELAARQGMAGPLLDRVFQAAFAAALRVRGETAVAEPPVSLVTSARQVAQDIHGDLRRCKALLIGLGEMGELLAGELREAGAERLVLLHPSAARSQAVAGRLKCHFRPWEERQAALIEADLVVCDHGTGQCSVTRDMAVAALKGRKQRPIFFIDAAVPGDIDPAVGDLPDAFLFDIEDLEKSALKDRPSRDVASALAWQLLDEELAAFLRQDAEPNSPPAIDALRRYLEELRQEVLDDGDGADGATRALIDRLLQAPTGVLRAALAEEPARGESLEQALRQLFRLSAAVSSTTESPDNGPPPPPNSSHEEDK